jgi:ubiquitin C-terminal hydrolase
MNCLHCSDTFERSVDLSLAINEVDSLTDALKSFTKVETVDDANHACENCGQPVQVLKQLTVSQLPDVLVIHLKRFVGFEFSSEKVHKIIEYPKVLDMEPFVSDTQLNMVSFASLDFLYLCFWQYLALIHFIFVLIYPDPIRDS